MSAHTPGPWKYGVRKDNSIWLSLGDWRTGPHFQADLCASEADAKLIVAAPELLEALQKLVKINEEHNEAVSKIIAKPLGWKDSYLDHARAAIAKAKGEA